MHPKKPTLLKIEDTQKEFENLVKDSSTRTPDN